MTLSPEEVDRNDDVAVKALWSRWQKQVKRAEPNAKILCIPERHEPNEEYPRGALHFHALMADCTLNLVSAVDAKTGEFLYTQFGDKKYNVMDWDFGFSTCIILPQEHNKRRVANYMIAYVTKQMDIDYNKKRYFRTHNLAFKDKLITY